MLIGRRFVHNDLFFEGIETQGVRISRPWAKGPITPSFIKRFPRSRPQSQLGTRGEVPGLNIVSYRTRTRWWTIEICVQTILRKSNSHEPSVIPSTSYWWTGSNLRSRISESEFMSALSYVAIRARELKRRFVRHDQRSSANVPVATIGCQT